MCEKEVERERKHYEQLLKCCEGICGERKLHSLAIGVEQSLAECLGFQNACVLFYHNEKLLSMEYIKTLSGQVMTEEVIELPSTIGLTGKALKERQVVTSAYGKADALYSPQVDNTLRLKHLHSLMLIPLFANSTLVGILHLANHKLGNTSQVDPVVCA